MAAILEASGIKTARYASPHVNDFRERIMLGSEFFPEDIYAQAGNELKEIVQRALSSAHSRLFDPDSHGGDPASFFELATLWFFLCSRLSRCDAMSVETGMGGRLDATNILDPLASVITIIELEHTEYLGTTIAAIAGEKAGIIKPGRPIILAEQRDEALQVFKEHAARKNSPLIYFPDCAEVRDVRVGRDGTRFTLNLKNGAFPDLLVPMPGEVQAYNAGLAVLALQAAFPGITEKSVREGLAGFALPARFQIISAAPPVAVVDGAHTPGSVGMCVDTFAGLYQEGAILVFGCAEGKDFLSMAKICAARFSQIIITTPGNFKKSNPAEVYAAFAEEAKTQSPQTQVHFIPDTAQAIGRAESLALEMDLPILGTGSFYLAAEIRGRLESGG
ncbi:MAG: Mur ligase family protein [Treponema sp.]|nr:Mur ligase family protein [Treponema sp.]